MISIVIPSFNEEKRLPSTLEKILGFIKSQKEEFEIIVVDDASSDKTAQVAQNFKNNFPNLKVVTLEKNSGKGAAVKKGFTQANGEIVLFTDADLSTPISEFPKLLEKLNQGYDIAIGSRAIDRSLVKQHQNFFRELMGRVFNFLVQGLVIKGISDTQCGFKAFKKSSCQEIFAKQSISGFSFDVELLFLAKRSGLKIAQVGVLWYNHPDSKVSPFKSSWESLSDLFRIRTRHASKNRGLIDSFLFLYRKKTFWKFAVVGFTGTVVDYSIYLILTRGLNLTPLSANPLSVETAIIWNFTFNNLWTFSGREGQRTLWKKFISFQIVSFGGLLLSQIQILLFTEFLNIFDLLAKALTIPAVAVFNYLVNSRWTFQAQERSRFFSPGYFILILFLFIVYLVLVSEIEGSFKLFLTH